MLKGIVACAAIVLGAGIYFYTLDNRPSVKDAGGIVDEAVRYLEEKGPDLLVQEINTHKPNRWNRGALYVFMYVTEPRGLMIAHANNPELVNKNLYDLTDPNGKLFVKAYLDGAIDSKEGHSEVSFEWPNPVTNKIENKVCVCRLTKDRKYVVCSGVYPK